MEKVFNLDFFKIIINKLYNPCNYHEKKEEGYGVPINNLIFYMKKKKIFFFYRIEKIFIQFKTKI